MQNADMNVDMNVDMDVDVYVNEEKNHDSENWRAFIGKTFQNETKSFTEYLFEKKGEDCKWMFYSMSSWWVRNGLMVIDDSGAVEGGSVHFKDSIAYQ